MVKHGVADVICIVLSIFNFWYQRQIKYDPQYLQYMLNIVCITEIAYQFFSGGLGFLEFLCNSNTWKYQLNYWVFSGVWVAQKCLLTWIIALCNRNVSKSLDIFTDFPVYIGSNTQETYLPLVSCSVCFITAFQLLCQCQRE